MAQQITFWKMEGKSDIEIKTIRLKSKADIAQVMTTIPSGAQVATLDRTDRQSLITHEIWKSKDYVSLEDRF
jgi:hypothetical protein